MNVLLEESLYELLNSKSPAKCKHVFSDLDHAPNATRVGRGALTAPFSKSTFAAAKDGPPYLDLGRVCCAFQRTGAIGCRWCAGWRDTPDACTTMMKREPNSRFVPAQRAK